MLPRMSAAGRKEVAGSLAGKPLQSARREASVLIGWGGPALRDCLDAHDHPEHSAGPMLRNGLGPATTTAPGPSGLAGSPGLAESGTSPRSSGGPDRRDHRPRRPALARPPWGVRRFLDRLPDDPPPDQGPLAK